jgi:protein TonB
MGDGGPGLGDALSVGSSTQPVVVAARAKATSPVTVSTGVLAGMLMTPIRPVYPAMARAVRLQGAVTIEAIISKTGRIESVHAVSGPEMLQRAALDAVAAARYRPYLLNGQPTEVMTTITVVFSMGS